LVKGEKEFVGALYEASVPVHGRGSHSIGSISNEHEKKET